MIRSIGSRSIGSKGTVVGLLAIFGTCFASVTYGNVSSWSQRTGFTAASDVTYFCEPEVTGASPSSANPQRVRSRLKLVPSQSDAPIQDNIVFNSASQRSRAKCFSTSARTGAFAVATTGWSTDAGGDIMEAACPSSKPFGGTPQCQVDGGGFTLRYVYDGTDCGTGISSIGTSEFKGQMTGTTGVDNVCGPFGGIHQLYQGTNIPVPVPPTLYNNTMANGVNVFGTDGGGMFVSNNQMYYLFGDTYGDKDKSAATWRSNVVGISNDADPSDGILFQNWETNGVTSQAAQVITSPHQLPFGPPGLTGTEFTAIPVSGVGVTQSHGLLPGDNSFHTYRIAWFVSIHQWAFPLIGSTFQANYSTLAYSTDNGPWTRGNAAPAGVNPPVWPANSNFGPGAIWFDRYNRYVYFFGIKADNGAIRLARVRSAASSILNKTQYEYWSGSSWVQDSDGNYSEAIPAPAGAFGTAANIIPASATQVNYSEISVAFDSYANKFILMLQNIAPAGGTTSQIEVWTSSAITGSWSKLNANAQLPRTTVAAGAVYAPMTSDQLLVGAGQDVYYMLSQWDCVYNTGLWHFTVNRTTTGACFPPSP
jgi:hypothetical protein